MTLNLTNYDPMIKEHYAPGPVMNMAAQKNKALGLLGKRNRKPSGQGGGKYWVQPIQFGLPGGGSSDLATAIASSANNSLYDAFNVTRKKHYRLGKVDNETIEATATGDMDAFEPAFDEFDKCIEAEGNYLNFRFFRSGGGYLARMTNSSFATTVITLLGLLILVLVVLAVIPTLIKQTTALVNAAPEISQRLQGFLIEKFPQLTDSTSTIRQSLNEIGAAIQAKGASLAQGVISSALSLISAIVFIVVVLVSERLESLLMKHG